MMRCLKYYQQQDYYKEKYIIQNINSDIIQKIQKKSDEYILDYEIPLFISPKLIKYIKDEKKELKILLKKIRESDDDATEKIKLHKKEKEFNEKIKKIHN